MDDNRLIIQLFNKKSCYKSYYIRALFPGFLFSIIFTKDLALLDK